MEFWVYAMIYAGAAVMLLNIVRYWGFAREMKAFGNWGQMSGLVLVPLVLLVLFLAGYLGVALFGVPDILIAGILFGGSLYVLIVLEVNHRIIGRMREGRERIDMLYEQAKSSLDNLTRDYQAVFRINLTKDQVVERSGKGLYDSDLRAETYTQLLHDRRVYLVTDPDEASHSGSFTRGALLKAFEEGTQSVEEMTFCRMSDGHVGFVKMQATLAEEPGTGDVWAFITESVENGEVVNEALFNKALAGQYDMITYLVNGRYGVVIGEANGSKRGSIFPREKDGDYMEYLADQVAPVVVGTPEQRIQVISSLGLKRVERELAAHEPYEVDIACEIDGERFYKRFSYYLVDAQARFYLLMKSDTTDFRRVEAERSERLEHALEEARRASESKTTFLSNMSHDIRTPMNAILGYTRFARSSDDPQKIREYLGKIDSSGKYLLALINDVLEMSRIESGKIDLEPVPVNLVSMMDEVRDMFEMQMHEKDIDYTVDASGVCMAGVMCDKIRLKRVLLNLLSNAYKFTPEHGAVTVTLEQIGPPSGGCASYRLRVKDTGIGMTPEFAARVFDAFERERNTTASGIQGTGLGMAIAKRLVDAMGGSIQVQSEPGRGTEFTVDLRFPLQDPTLQECDAPPTEGRHPILVDLAGKRVLLAEDNEVNREIATMVLEGLEMELDAVVDGSEALEALVAAGPGAYDLVITDIQMPGMDGFALTRAVRSLEDPVLSSTPIIAMSANAFAEDKRAGREAGMDGYVAKPIDVDEVASTISEVLAGR